MMTERELVVWHVFGAMNIGGAEMRTLELDEAIRPAGVRFEYMTLAGIPGVLDERIEASGTFVRPVPLGLTWPWRYYRALRRFKPHAVDSHVATFSGMLVAIAWLARVPVRIAHFRSDGDGHPDTLRRRLQRSVMKFLIRTFATHIIGVSPSSLSDGYDARWPEDPRARVIPNGVPGWEQGPPDSTEFRSTLGLGPASTVVMHVGRPSHEKNRPFALRAVQQLRSFGVDAHLVLVGGIGADEPAMVAARKEFGGAWCHEVGAQQGARSWMQHADVLVLPSIREGLPGVVLESLSVGVPVVSASIPGSRFIASEAPGVTIVDEFDADRWARSLKDVLEGDRDKAALSSKFRESAFTMGNVMSAHVEMYFSRGFNLDGGDR